MSPMMKMVGREGMQMKNIITFAAVTTVVMAIVLIAFSPLASASAVERNYDGVGGVLTYEGELPRDANKESRSISVYEGEDIRFENVAGDQVDVIVSGAYEGDADKRSGCMDYPVKANKSWDSSGMKTGYFFKVVEKARPEIGCWFGVEKQSFSLKLEKDKVQEKESFYLSLKTNNKKQGVMKLSIEDTDGYSIMNDNAQDIYEVLVNYTGRAFDSDPVDAEGEPVCGIEHDAEGKLIFNTSQLDMNGDKYSIILEDYATEVEEEVSIAVEKIYLEVECDEEVLKDKDIVILIESSFYEKKVDVTVGTFYNKSLTFDEEGKKKVKIPTDDIDYGRYKVTVKAHGMWDTRYVLIKKCDTSIEVPDDAIVGDIVQIEGTSESGDLAIFVIDDVFKGEATITDDEFKWDWDTSGELDGYQGIEVFILNESAKNPFSIGDSVSNDWQREEGVDASASIILFTPTFSMTVSESIAKGDPAVISGEASGTDHVYIIVFNYKGKVMYPPGVPGNEVPATRTPVDEGEWTETIDKLDSGEYVVIALSEGEDGVTEAVSDGRWEIGGECKTMEQRVAILEDKMTTAGSDDLYELAYFSVTMPKVRLTVPETVKIGDPISVKVETNMEDGVEAFVSLLSNASIINETTVVVTSGSGDASFDTNGLQPGKYVVTGSIKGEAYDEVGVILVEAEEESEEVEESIAQNEPVTEPETTVETIENAGESELKEEHEGEEQKLPVIAWDLVIAIIVAIFISIVVRRRC
nr:hypothetical membrane protein [uncultured archaeon]